MLFRSYNEDGTWNREFIRIGDRNPRLSAEYDYQREYVTRAFNTTFAEFSFTKDLKFRTTLSYDFNAIKGKDWSDPRTSNGDDVNGQMVTKFYERKKLVWKNHLTLMDLFTFHSKITLRKPSYPWPKKCKITDIRWI